MNDASESFGVVLEDVVGEHSLFQDDVEVVAQAAVESTSQRSLWVESLRVVRHRLPNGSSCQHHDVATVPTQDVEIPRCVAYHEGRQAPDYEPRWSDATL